MADLFFETNRDQRRANNGRNPQGSVRVLQSKVMEPNRDLSSAQTKFNKSSKLCNNFDRNQKPGMQSHNKIRCFTCSKIGHQSKFCSPNSDVVMRLSENGEEDEKKFVIPVFVNGKKLIELDIAILARI